MVNQRLIAIVLQLASPDDLRTGATESMPSLEGALPECTMPRLRSPPPLEVRRRRTRNAAIGLGAVATASLVGIGIVYGVATRPGVDSTDAERALGFTAITAGVSLAALIGTGIGLAVLSREAAHGWPKGDPRSNTDWAWKDKALTRHLIVWSSILGASVVGLSVCTGVLFGGKGDDDTGPVSCSAAFLAFTGVFAVPTLGVSLARHHHRWPLRAYRLGIGPNGLSLKF